MDQKTAPSPAASGAPVEVTGLCHSFGGFQALKSVDIAIRGGEFVALLGPSGCGKTTLLRSIAGLVHPSAGDIRVGGEPITSIPVHRRGLGMVFQSYALFPHMTIAENVRFGLKMQGVEKAEAGRRVAEALALVRMDGYEERYPTQLSGGQQQRVALARALVTHPKALLLDEPFGALDAKLRESMQIDLRRLQRRLGITTIFVTHDQQEAMTMADRIAVMHDGRIEQFDAPRSIYDDPQTLFVADFIGVTNSFSGTIERRDGVALLHAQGLEEPFRLSTAARDIAEGPVTCIVRPEQIQLLDDAPDGICVVPARVTDVVFAGEKLNVYAETPVGSFVVAASRSARSVEPGQPIKLGLAPGTMRLFPDSTKP